MGISRAKDEMYVDIDNWRFAIEKADIVTPKMRRQHMILTRILLDIESQQPLT